MRSQATHNETGTFISLYEAQRDQIKQDQIAQSCFHAYMERSSVRRKRGTAREREPFFGTSEDKYRFEDWRNPPEGITYTPPSWIRFLYQCLLLYGTFSKKSELSFVSYFSVFAREGGEEFFLFPSWGLSTLGFRYHRVLSSWKTCREWDEVAS